MPAPEIWQSWLNARDSKSRIQETVSRVRIPLSPPFDFLFLFAIIARMKSFNERVYEIVAQIPAGRVATFGQIARMIGRPRMARFVGFASNNKACWHLPWHRVVFKDGTLIGEPFHDQQYRDLKNEGVKFTRDKKVIMDKYQWQPAGESMPANIRDWPLKF